MNRLTTSQTDEKNKKIEIIPALFEEDTGHLAADIGYVLLNNNVKNELQSLEIAEHLSDCDICLNKYIDFIEKNVKEAPEISVRLQHIKKTRIHLFSTTKIHYLTAIAAIVFALLFFRIFISDMPSISENNSLRKSFGSEFISQIDQYTDIVVQTIMDGTEQISSQTQKNLSYFDNHNDVERRKSIK